MLTKTYVPKEYEQRVYKKTEPLFATHTAHAGDTYTIMMPPPNVTGSLHLGHALNDTLQDILIRFHRKKGKNVLWQPGTDHAGIATQFVVERELAKEGLTRHELGRDKLIERIWQWKEHAGHTIITQKKALGISPDWDRLRFTMDDGFSNAVRKVFVTLHKQGLIYRSKRLVNWDTKLQTAISDLEAIPQDKKGYLYYIHYPLSDTDGSICVATTRPETLFGDTAVAVHPDDERYKHLIGKRVCQPITERLIPVIADTYCDREKGSGAVKITPGHDFNDFAVGERHGLEMINILDATGHLIAPAPDAFIGLCVDDARSKVIQKLTDLGVLEKSEPILHAVPHSEKSGVEIQPWLTDQWFLDAETLAQPAIKAVEEKRTVFFPENWESTYFEWLRHIQPWCISRQIWWGHQIPAWHGDDGHIFVELTEEDAYTAAHAYYGHDDITLTRETDVLDTWFSSALWPFATLGWPDQTSDLDRYYPTDFLITGWDIIFFWVARMMMMGLHFMGDVPFKTVYIHPLIRDEKGQKMSKTKGNVIDPLSLIDRYGADALRFTMALLATPGRDIKLGESRVEASRNFITKLWNAARFLEMNDCVYDASFDTTIVTHDVNRWIINKTNTMVKVVSRDIEAYRFDRAAQTLYHHLWGTVCDMYVECLKSLLQENAETSDETRKTAAFALMQFVKVANPIMPFVTEIVWEAFTPSDDILVSQPWPESPTLFEKETGRVDFLMGLIEEIRSLKGLLGLQSHMKLPLMCHPDNTHVTLIQHHWPWIKHLARLDIILTDARDGVPFIYNNNHFILCTDMSMDLAEARHLLEQKKNAWEKEIGRLDSKLTNDAFKFAKPDLWEADNKICTVKKSELDKINQILVNWS
jgi:valyl-tRNA synthetase